jgi:hypothetical protein
VVEVVAAAVGVDVALTAGEAGEGFASTMTVRADVAVIPAPSVTT